MAGVLYRCIFCEASHEVARRADGPVYLRCPTTYQWAWYDARAFEGARPARGAGRAGRPSRSRVTKAAGPGSRSGARRAAAPKRRRAAAPRRAKAGASRRAGRRAPSRPASRKRSGRGGRR